MQAEETVQIDDIGSWNGDVGTERVVVGIAMGHHNVQAVGRTALKDGH